MQSARPRATPQRTGWPTTSFTTRPQPVKSVSGLIGIGEETEIVEHGVPCQYCDLQVCKMRRG